MIRANTATGFIARLRGLIGRPSIAVDEALLIPKCRRIHTYGMRFPIDAVFMDASGRAVAALPSIMPWRVMPSVPNAASCLELSAGGINRHHIRLGQIVPFINNEI